MPYKPLDEKIYRQYLKMVGWDLNKGSIDYKLMDEDGAFVCTIKIAHGKKSKREVIAYSVQRTQQEFKKRGLSWPPKKKSKNS
jgi:hypothetical protein